MKFKTDSKQRIKVIQGLRSFKNTLPPKVKKIINKKGQIYSKTLENWKKIVGDEDNGQTSAWFLFSAMGFYPVAPVTGEYVIGSPLFKSVEITLPNKKNIFIDAKNNSKENIFVNALKVELESYSKNYINHNDLENGARISFDMSSKPNYKWGSSKESVPYSMTNK